MCIATRAASTSSPARAIHLVRTRSRANTRPSRSGTSRTSGPGWAAGRRLPGRRRRPSRFIDGHVGSAFSIGCRRIVRSRSGGSPPRIAEVDLMVTSAWAHARGLDSRVEPFDRRTLLRIRANVHDLRHRPFFEPLDPEGISHGRIHLRAGDLELLVHLLNGRLLRQRDHQGPPPRVPVVVEDPVEVDIAIARPPQALEGGHPSLNSSPLQREPESIRRSIQPRHPSLERLITRRARTVDHDEPVRGELQESDPVTRCPILVVAVLRVVDHHARSISLRSNSRPAVCNRRERGQSRPDRWRVPNVPSKQNLSTALSGQPPWHGRTNQGGRS